MGFKVRKYQEPYIGGGGPIRLHGSRRHTSRRLVFTPDGRQVPAYFIYPLKTQSQVERAERLWRLLGFSNSAGRSATIAPRPYMRPALQACLPVLASFWQDAVKAL